jgi:hypothetical protein
MEDIYPRAEEGTTLVGEMPRPVASSSGNNIQPQYWQDPNFASKMIDTTYEIGNGRSDGFSFVNGNVS